MLQTNTVNVTAAPGVGLPTPRDSGPALFDSTLTASASITPRSYAWDFDGSGTNDLTCYTHSGIDVSFEHIGLYLAKVTVTDTAGDTYTDTAIVNVMDRAEMNSSFTAKWNAMKSALAGGNITDAITHYHESVRTVFSDRFTALSTFLPQLVENMNAFTLVNVSEYYAECDLRSVKDGVEYSFQVLFMLDNDGIWRILSY